MRILGLSDIHGRPGAVRLALLSRFGLLVGGAGVGKTTVLKATVAASEHFGRSVHHMTLARRAAVRMT